MIARVRGDHDASCLVMSINDHAEAGTYAIARRYNREMVAAQRAAAVAEGCAFFDVIADRDAMQPPRSSCVTPPVIRHSVILAAPLLVACGQSVQSGGEGTATGTEASAGSLGDGDGDGDGDATGTTVAGSAGSSAGGDASTQGPGAEDDGPDPEAPTLAWRTFSLTCPPLPGLGEYESMLVELAQGVPGGVIAHGFVHEGDVLWLNPSSGADSIHDATAESVALSCGNLHSDNGGPMKGATMLATLQKLGVVPSFSRPSVSDDNAFVESLFRTAKYRPNYPSGPFASLVAAREWVTKFVGWYNDEHQHSAIRFVTPSDRHTGRDIAVLAHRREVYGSARDRNPQRWSSVTRNWAPIDTVILKRREGTTHRKEHQIV